MGMHFGFIAAECDWAALHAALEGHCGAIVDQGEIVAAEWFDLPRGQDVFHVATKDGRVYLLDPAMVLSSSSDVMVALASELSCLVVGAGGETVSGTFWFAAADRGVVRRVHFEVAATLTESFDLGDPLPSERRVAWNDIDGKGIIACLADLDFDPGVLERGAPGSRRVLWEGEKFPEPGDLGRRINEHCQLHKRAAADDWTKNITVQTRGDGGFDLQARPGGKSGIGRLFRRGR